MSHNFDLNGLKEHRVLGMRAINAGRGWGSAGLLSKKGTGQWEQMKFYWNSMILFYDNKTRQKSM